MAPLGVVAVAGGRALDPSRTRAGRRDRSASTPVRDFAADIWRSSGLATSSAFAAEGMVSLPDHMIAHILTMFIIPIGVVCSSFIPLAVVDTRPRTRRRRPSLVVPGADMARATVAVPCASRRPSY